MKAILMTATGGSSVLIEQEISEPTLKTSTEIKVRLHAAGVNPVDTKIRKGGVPFEEAIKASQALDNEQNSKIIKKASAKRPAGHHR